MDTERRGVTRPDGRNIDFLVAGPRDGLPLVLHEGTPIGLVLYPKTVQAARLRGLRVILAARPGYEGSTPRPGGQWLAANIRGARVHLMPGDGHLSMTVSAFDRILDDLLDLAGLTA